MISVMNDFEIDRNPASTLDLSFFGVESPKEEERMDPIEPGTPSSLDTPVESQDLEDARVRVSPVEENQQQQRFTHRVSEPEPEMDDEGPVEMNGFADGDMVWGKVKSHPWWPGHIFNESFAWRSVRRAKRDDSVLVAFFGDSSYGWFDPAELIPFEQHFMEKSRQTNLRSFVRAVEESIDETGRRAALGLTCRCQNPHNFRPSEVANYYWVDVVGYERNGIYSRRQINRERESFDAKDTIDFLRQLAVMPRGSEAKDVEWHRNEALALALRRRRYEEFDETYAQAFGQTPVRPSINEMGVPEQAESFARRVAPLSGTLVIAEALGDKKSKHPASFASSKASSSSSSSSHKHKDKSLKKNNYVLKRRDERPAASTVSPPLPDAFFILDDPVAAFTGGSSDYVLQKRESAADGIKPDENGQNHSAESPQTPPMPADPDTDFGGEQSSPYATLPVDVGVVKKEKKTKKRSVDAIDSRDAGTEKKRKKKHGESPQIRPMPADPGTDFGGEQSAPYAVLPVDVGVVKKEKKTKKRSVDAIDSRDEAGTEKNKRKKKHGESPQTPPMPADPETDFGGEQSAPYAALPVDSVVVKKEKKTKKRSVDAIDSREEAGTEKKRKKKHVDTGFGHDFSSDLNKPPSSSPSAEVSRDLEISVDSPRPVSPPSADFPLDQLDLPSVLADLQSLALDPFFGIKRNAPSITRHVLVRFRSLVYSKSMVVPVPDDSEVHGQEAQASKPAAAASSAVPLSIKEAKEPQQQKDHDSSSSSAKPYKLMKRPDDPTKAGRKRPPSDRQEEISEKRMKKVNKLKLLASERKAALNPKTSPEASLGDNCTTTTTAITAEALGPLTAEPAKKPEKQEQLPPPPPKRESPTFMFMKFPPRSPLPSVSNLKARFARFGPLEVNSTRVFWKSHSCRVQFKYKSDAAKALSYVKSNDFFGQMQVEYTIKEVEGPAPEPAAEPSKPQSDPQAYGRLQLRPGNGGGAQPRPQQPHGRLKSILKKPGEEAARESQRVKFMLYGSDSPPSASGNCADFADGASKSTSFQLPPPPIPPPHALPVRSYEPPRSPQMPPPMLRPAENMAPPAARFGGPPPQSLRQQEQWHGVGDEMEGRDRKSNVDISHQMLSLLMRCNDIVAGLRALPGFVPYRPL